jgi:FlaA1/EpsC-like NDP-sugar epimerase
MRIVDLAEDLIRLSGLVPGKDVQIEFTGIRPGEKLFEELHTPSEALGATAHPQLFRLHSEGELDRVALGRFLSAVDCETSREGIVGRIRELLGEHEGQALSLARAGDSAS